MKEIKIDKYNSPDTDSIYTNRLKYSVRLGNQTEHYFGSKKDAKEFLAATNRFLNANMHELNFIFCDVWRKYRLTWPYFKHNKPTMSAKLIQKEKKCLECINSVERTLNITVDRSHYTNGNSFVFSHLNSVCDSLVELSTIIREIHRAKSNGVDVYECNLINKRVEAIAEALKLYGTTEKHYVKTVVVDFPPLTAVS